MVGIILTLLSFSSADNIDNDSLHALPPRLRGIGDPEYFNALIKPRARDSLSMRLVGRWPFGPGFEVYGDSARQIVCYGGGSGVLLFDISTPDNPVRLSQICADGLINQLLIKDSLLFVASNGLAIYNITDPANPSKISAAFIPVRDFCLKDTFAYCAGEDSLRVLNIADLSNPFQITALKDSGYLIGISGNYAYTGGRWQLNAVDISNPHSPCVVNSLPVEVWALAVDGTQLYANIYGSGFTIYNISNPLSIWQESVINGLGGLDFYKHGDYVYLPEFWIIDVSDSANPAVVGDTVLPVTAWSVWVNNNFGYAYVANYYDGLRLININNPMNPLPGNSYYGADDSRDVFVQGNYAYLSNNRKGLKILDITNPANPLEAGEYDTIGTPPGLQTAWIRDSVAYLPCAGPIRFRTINISNPAYPVIMGSCRLLDIANDIVVRDTLAYVVGYGRPFQAVKISNPSTPDTLPRYLLPMGGTAWSVYIQDSFGYVADGDSGLRILNITNPAAPFECGHFDAPDAVYSVYVKDSFAYLAALSAGLRIVNIKIPSNPQEVGYYIAPGWTRDVWVTDSVAFIAASGCIEALNITSPTIPNRIAYYNGLPESPRRIFYQTPYLYYAAFESGMGILHWDEVDVGENGRFEHKRILFSVNPSVVNRYINMYIYGEFDQDKEILIFDRGGRIVTKMSIKANFNHRIGRIDVHNMPAGVYFVGIGHDYSIYKKVVVVH